MESYKKGISISEVKKNDGKYGRKHYIIIGGRVFDITGFKHPAGQQVFDGNTIDKLDDFNMVGHSNSAKSKLKSMYIGDLIF